MISHWRVRTAWLCLAIIVTACQPVPSFKCTDAIGCVTIAPKDPVKIGALQLLSGDNQDDQAQVIQLTLKLRGNKLGDHPIALQMEDELCSIEGGKTAAAK